MTSQLEQIQVLLLEIDGWLRKVNLRPPMGVAEIAQQRGLLEKIRNYLDTHYQQLLLTEKNLSSVEQEPELVPEQVPVSDQDESIPISLLSTLTAQQIRQSVEQEMNGVRVQFIKYFQAELKKLSREKEVLVQEITKLREARQALDFQEEQQRSQAEILTNFLEVIATNLQDTLPQQITEILTEQISQFNLQSPVTKTEIQIEQISQEVIVPDQQPPQKDLVSAKITESSDIITSFTELLAQLNLEEKISEVKESIVAEPQNQEISPSVSDLKADLPTQTNPDEQLTGLLDDHHDDLPTPVIPPGRKNSAQKSNISSASKSTLLNPASIANKQSVPLVTNPDSAIPPSLPSSSNSVETVFPVNPPEVWYLGIDLGATDISATLFNCLTGVLYPLSWSTSGTIDVRLAIEKTGLLWSNFPSGLSEAIPYAPATIAPVSESNQPNLSELPKTIIKALQELFALFLKPNKVIVPPELDPETFHLALRELAGVILGCPIDCPDTYRFNLREAVLGAKLVASAEQIFFIENAIALLISELPLPKQSTKLNSTSDQENKLSLLPVERDNYWYGGTLVLNIDPVKTEICLVRLPEQIGTLTYKNFQFRSVDNREEVVNFVQIINREFNTILIQMGMTVEEINQAIWIGENSELTAIATWLRQKLPNAKIIQDQITDDRKSGVNRIAKGLAKLPLYPQILDITQHQYEDYFLFMELLRVIPEQDLQIAEVMKLLEERGINTRVCEPRILAILNGKIPVGLVPPSNEIGDNIPNSPTHIFEKLDEQTYRPLSQQCDRFRRYLRQILAHSYQKLEEPLTVGFMMDVVK